MNDLVDRLPSKPLEGFKVDPLTDNELSMLFAGDVVGAKMEIALRVNQQVLNYYRKIIDQVVDEPLEQAEDYDYLCSVLASRDTSDPVADSWRETGLVGAAVEILNLSQVDSLVQKQSLSLGDCLSSKASWEDMERVEEIIFDTFDDRLTEIIGFPLSERTLNMLVSDFLCYNLDRLEIVFKTDPADWLKVGNHPVRVEGNAYVRAVEHMNCGIGNTEFVIGRGMKVRPTEFKTVGHAAHMAAENEMVLAG